MRGSAPLRFLAMVLGGWAAVRVALTSPPWPVPTADAAATARAAPPRTGAAPAQSSEATLPQRPGRAASKRREGIRARAAIPGRPIGSARSSPGLAPLLVTTTGARSAVIGVGPLSPPEPASPGTTSERLSARRWSVSAWSFVRRGDAAPLAPGGLLGGSQAGARLTYRLNRDTSRPLALSLRLAAPLRRPAGAEAAFGLDWRPSRRVPVHLLAERRQALAGEGRSAFGITVHGGVSDARLGRFRLDAYAQAGVVGARSRDPFADGSIRLSLPMGGNARAGAGAWAAAQPGLSRLDLGPQAALRLPVGGRTVMLAADWRLRVAGNARPGSGPTLTMVTDF